MATRLTIAHELFKIAWPSIVSSVVAQANGLTTIFFVASFDDQYLLGSVGLGAMAQNVFGFSLGRGLNSALDTLISQSNGAGDDTASGVHLRRAQIISIAVSIPCMVALYFSEYFFRFVGINDQSAKDAGDYVRGTLPSMPFCFLYNATRSFLSAVKIPRPDSYVTLISAALHWIWCVIFLRKLQWGAFGAGFCVTCSNLVQYVLLTAYVAVARPGPCRQVWHCCPWRCAGYGPDRVSQDRTGGFRGYFKIALPSAVLMWSEWWVYEIMSLLAGLCGTEALAAHTAVCNLMLILFMAPVGLGNATSAVVGNAIGEGNTMVAQESIRLACGATLVFFVIVAILVVALREQLAHVFSTDSDVVATFSSLCFILAPFLVLDGVQTVFEGALRGLGLQAPASRMKLISMIGVRLLGAYVLAILLHIGVIGVWLGSLSGMAVTMVLYARIYRAADFESIASGVRQQLRSGPAVEKEGELGATGTQRSTSVDGAA